MKKNVIILLLTLASFNLFAKGSGEGKVASQIEAKFRKDFGNVPGVSWQIIGDVSIASFQDNGDEKEVYYTNDGDMFGIGKQITKGSLPLLVTKAIAERFPTAALQTVYEFRSKDAPTRYFLYVITPRYSRIVSADEFGELQVNQRKRNLAFHN